MKDRPSPASRSKTACGENLFDRISKGRFGGLAVIAAAIVFLHCGDPSHSPRPNVLLVSIDSLRPDHLHSYGYKRPTSPTIDSLARDGALFRTAISSSSWTLPAHMTLMTGMAPEEHGVNQAKKRLEPQAITLAEVFQQAGYMTAGFVSGPTVAASYGFDQGFDLYDDQTVVKWDKASHRGATSPDLVRLVVGWFDRWAADRERRPFFLFLHMWDVHYDFTPPPPYDRMFDPDYRGTVSGDDFESGPSVHREMHPRDLEHVVALYDGEIRYTDTHLGKILDWLRDRDILDETIVVVTSDHGDEFFEHGQKGHVTALYDETIRIPLIVRYPKRVLAGQAIEAQVRLMDVPSTILGLAAIEAPSGFGTSTLEPGLDLTPWITGMADEPFPELIAHSSMEVLGMMKSSVRTRTHKLIRNEKPSGRGSALYDLIRDPEEQRALGPTQETRDVARHLHNAQAAWHRSLEGAPQLSGDAELGEEQIEKLRALGYVR